MTAIPKKIMPSPMIRTPYCLMSSFLLVKVIRNPHATRSRAYFLTGNATICAVIVVPMSAPRMTPMACDSDIRFAVTNPTSITVVTEDDWMMAVTNVPVTRPMRRLVVSLPRIRRIFSPATILRDSPIWSIPNRNRASPPASWMNIWAQSSPASPVAATPGIANIQSTTPSPMPNTTRAPTRRQRPSM